MNGFFYIEITTDEWNSRKVAFVNTLEEAMEALKYVNDWYRPNGTGKIYFQQTGVDFVKKTRIPYGKTEPVECTEIIGHTPEFICRGKGLDENGEVIISKELY